MPPGSDKPGQARRRVGAYAKLLANYASDDAIIDAGEAAELLFVRGLAFCATSDSDGYITDAQVTRYVGAGMKDAEKRARKLAQVGVWERVDGGYLVRSWTKIHETAADKGRRRKADRERKRRAEASTDSDASSETIPDGIQTEGLAESLSMTEQCSDTTEQRTTEQVGSTSSEHRNETLRALPAPKHAEEPHNPADARCTAHRGVGDPGPCNGCRAARERAEKAWNSWNDRETAKREAAIRACPECGGDGWRTHEDGSLAGKCEHIRVLRAIGDAS